MASIKEILASRLKYLRNNMEMTQLRLSEIVGVEVTTVQNWEAGRRWPQPKQIAAVARALGVAETELFRDPDTIREPTEDEALAALTKFVMRHK